MENKLPIGTKVRIAKSSQFYEEQGKHEIGIVEGYKNIGTDTSLVWMKVKFKDGYTNNYRMMDLEIIEKKAKPFGIVKFWDEIERRKNV